MAHAAVDLTDLGGFAGTSFSNLSEREADQFYLEPEISLEYSFEGIVGQSSALRKVLEQVAIVAPRDSTVLLYGETGTGKELIARAIHNLSSRRDRPYVRMAGSLTRPYSVHSSVSTSESFGACCKKYELLRLDDYRAGQAPYRLSVGAMVIFLTSVVARIQALTVTGQWPHPSTCW